MAESRHVSNRRVATDLCPSHTLAIVAYYRQSIEFLRRVKALEEGAAAGAV